MKEFTKTCTIYQAFDGTEFTDRIECAQYEDRKTQEYVVNLKKFEIDFPMADSNCNYRAYKVNSENEFEMLKTYILNSYSDVYDDWFDYNGNGWYVLASYEYGGADLYKLSVVVKDWCDVLNLIAKNTMEE